MCLSKTLQTYLSIRTRKEMSKVDAHWELIEAIKEMRDEVAPQTLLTINGDIPDRQKGMELATKYGIDGVMIGRGIFHNPFAFEKEPREHTSKELLDLFRLHLELFEKYSMKKHNNLKVYDVSLKFMCEVLEVQVNYGIN